MSLLNRLETPLATLYTGPADSFISLSHRLEISPEDIRALNPHVKDLEELSPGIPLDVPVPARRKLLSNRFAGLAPTSAYEFAKREKSLGVCEKSGPATNERIKLYHSTTVGGAAPDEVSWCSSLVNYCVEQSGRVGTDSKAARSWLDWGGKVEKNDWREGDIVVFWRESKTSWKGHVAFLVSWDGERPYVLGGNQSNCITIDDPYPFSQILSIRRAS
jgi:uncharacterized protein (TIGR02594 family)